MAPDWLPSRWALILAIFVLLIGSTAAVGVWEAVDAPGEQPAFETNVSDARASLETMTGVRETVIERDEETVRTVERVWRRPATGAYRVETLDGTTSGSELEVSDGRTLWLYDSDDQRVIEIDLGNASPPGNRNRIERLLTIADRTDDDAVSGGSISPLPVVPTDGGQGASTAGVAGSLRVSYEGTETVGSRSTYVFELDSRAKTTAFVSNFSQTLWLDQEWYVPLKRTTDFSRDNRDVNITVGYRNVTFNPELAEERFQFEPPANATVVDADRPRQKHFADRAGLRAASDFSLPEPSLPDSFKLVDATRTVSDRIRSIGLSYTNQTASVSVSKSNLTRYVPATEGKGVRISEHEAMLRNLGTELRISWTCANARYSVAGTGVTDETLVEIARSVGCE